MDKKYLENFQLPLDLKKFTEKLRLGHAVAVPSETVYGLAASILSPIGIENIFRLKARPFFDPLIVHIASFDDVFAVATQFPPLAKKLAQQFWPGPLTLILPKRSDLNPMITSGLETVAVRMPGHPLFLKLISELGAPIAAPSANKFGRTSPTSAQHVLTEFGDSLPILDGGICEIGIESTVVGFDPLFEKIFLYRPGAVTAEMLKKLAPVIEATTPAAPGQLQHHYMPNIPLVIFSENMLDAFIYSSIKCRLKSWLKYPSKSHLDDEQIYPSWMTLPTDPLLAARSMYQQMRNAAAEKNKNCIFLEYSFSDHGDGIWAAISDRLKKAATIIF